MFPVETTPSRGSNEPRAGEHVGIVVLHGVGETEPGWINRYLLPRLAGRPDAPSFEPHSEVHDLPDRGRSRPNQTFPAYIRRGRSGAGRSIAVVELFWADLSRIGTSTLANWLALLKLFYEAPQVLGDCFLEHSRSGFANAIAALVRIANWILRWPITGLNIVALVCALALLARQRLIDVGQLQPFLTVELPFALAGILAVLALLSLAFARWRVHRDIALSDIGMSTFVFSLVSIAAILAAKAYFLPEALANPAVYLMTAGVAIFSFWYIWNYGVLLAIVILAMLAAQQVVFRRSEDRIPLARPAAAVGLSVIQGVIYKIVIALLWVFIFVTLDFNERTETACQHDPLQACAYLADVQRDLIGIVVFNMMMVGLLVSTFFMVAMLRALLRIPARYLGRATWLPMPRMVVSPLVILVMLAGTIFNLAIFYWRSFIPLDLYELVDVRLLPWREVAGVMLGGGTALTIAFYVFRALQHAASGILHIVRDLVDHQYTPRFSFSRSLLPSASKSTSGHPRRARIESRLDTLLREIVQRERCDRIVFVAHSQGSIILYDYLATQHDEDAIGDVRSVDVLTLGSPLSHLYQYYFAKYAVTIRDPREINPQLSSWTNMWRMDDPIGNRIDLVNDTFVRNVPLRPGGHVDYWRETEVCEAILALIDPDRPKPAQARADAPEEAHTTGAP